LHCAHKADCWKAPALPLLYRYRWTFRRGGFYTDSRGRRRYREGGPVRRKVNRPARQIVLILVLVGACIAGLALFATSVDHWIHVRNASRPSQALDKLAMVRKAVSHDGYQAASVSRLTPVGRCAQHSYEAVHVFFDAHPCIWLVQGMLTLRKPGKDEVLVAITWVDMPTAAQASALQHLGEKPGTGSVYALQMPSASRWGNCYASGLLNTVAWAAEIASPRNTAEPTDPVGETIRRTIALTLGGYPAHFGGYCMLPPLPTHGVRTRV
jgi:hypothetical protein